MRTDDRPATTAATTTRFVIGDRLIKRDDGTAWTITEVVADDRCGDGVAFYVTEDGGKARLRRIGSWSVEVEFRRAPAEPDRTDPGPILDTLVLGLRSLARSLVFASLYVDAEEEAECRGRCDRFVAAITALGGDGTAEFDDAVERAQEHWADRG